MSSTFWILSTGQEGQPWVYPTRSWLLIRVKDCNDSRLICSVATPTYSSGSPLDLGPPFQKLACFLSWSWHYYCFDQRASILIRFGPAIRRCSDTAPTYQVNENPGMA